MLARHLVVLSLAAASSTAVGQISYWDVITGDWNVGTSWDTGLVPIAGDSARIDNNGTAKLASGVTPLLASVYVASGPGNVGRIEVLGGVLNSGLTFQIGASGIGTALFQGGVVNCDGSIVLASNPTAEGYLDIRAGADITTLHLTVGNSNYGYVNHNLGDLHCTSSLAVASNSGTGALYEFEDGTILCPSSVVGVVGEGTFHQSGGTFTSELTALVGSNSAANGLMTISGGFASFHNLHVASGGVGVYRQKGGEVYVSGSIRIAQNTSGTGTYKLQGGKLTAVNIFKGAGTPAFEMTGGRLVWTVFGANSTPFDLTPEGGVLAPRDADEGIAYVRGNLSILPGATYEADIHGITPTANQDQIDVKGMVRLAGKLIIELGYTPAPGHQYQIIKNDDVDPVIGEFLGLPEGECWDVTDPSLVDHRMIITYAGGDGNDVVVTNMGCPVDFNMDGIYDFFDISAFLAMYTSLAPCADLNNDGLFDFFDISIFITEFAAGCP